MIMASKALTHNFRINSAKSFKKEIENSDQINGECFYIFSAVSYDDQGLVEDLSKESISESLHGTSGYIRPKILFGKKLSANNVMHMIEKVQWNPDGNTVYDIYDNRDEKLYSKRFYVVNNKKVYKCLDNNYGKESSVPPTGEGHDNHGKLSNETDRYIWKYMYSISNDDFITDNYIPVTLDKSVQDSAVRGTIDLIKVESKGSNYSSHHLNKRLYISNYVYTTVTDPEKMIDGDIQFNSNRLYVHVNNSGGEINRGLRYISAGDVIYIRGPKENQEDSDEETGNAKLIRFKVTESDNTNENYYIFDGTFEEDSGRFIPGDIRTPDTRLNHLKNVNISGSGAFETDKTTTVTESVRTDTARGTISSIEVNSSGAITEVIWDNRGKNYNAEEITFSQKTSFDSSISVPTVTDTRSGSDGPGSGAAIASITVNSSGAITGVTWNARGTNYEVGDTLTFTQGDVTGDYTLVAADIDATNSNRLNNFSNKIISPEDITGTYTLRESDLTEYGVLHEFSYPSDRSKLRLKLLSSAGTTITLSEPVGENHLSPETNFYKNSALYVASGPGVGALRKIEKYEVTNAGEHIFTLDNEIDKIEPTSEFEIFPYVNINGDGSGAAAKPEIEGHNNVISRIQMLNVGEGYSWAEVTVSGNSGIAGNFDPEPAELRPIISPILGHGYDPVKELFSSRVGIVAEFRGNEQGNIPDGSNTQYNHVGIIKNPYYQDVKIDYSSGNNGGANSRIEYANGEATSLSTIVPGANVYQEISNNNNTAIYIYIGNVNSSNSSAVRINNVIREIDPDNRIIVRDSDNDFEFLIGSNNNHRTNISYNASRTDRINSNSKTFDQRLRINVGGEDIDNLSPGDKLYQNNASAVIQSIDPIDNTNKYIWVTEVTKDFVSNSSITKEDEASLSVQSVTNSDLEPSSGEIIWISKTNIITRNNPTNTERFKLIISF